MVSRGIIKEKPKSVNNGWKFIVWIMYLFHRYHYPYFILLLIMGLIGTMILHSVSFILSILLFVEVFYFSLAFHEASHMSFAKFVDVKTVSVSFIPYSIEIRTNFSRERKIALDDLHAIVFAGPIIPICLCLLILLIAKIFSLNIGVYFCCLIFLIINIMSLLPLKDSDGQRVYSYIKNNPKYLKILLAAIVYYFYRKSGIEHLKGLIGG